MARRRITIVLLLFKFLLGGSSLYGQESVSIRFRVFGAGLDHFKGLYYFDGKKHRPLSFNKSSRSKDTYLFHGTPELSIYALNPAYQKNIGDIARFLPLASCHLNRSLKEALLVLVAHPKNQKARLERRQYKLFLIDDSHAAFPRDSIQLINATEVNIFGNVAASRIDLRSDFSQGVDYSAYTENDKAVPISLAIKSENRPRLTMSNDLPLPRGRRVVLILMNPRREGSIRIVLRSLIETVPSQKVRVD